MQVEKIMSSVHREKVGMFIKNKIDISDLIDGYSVKNMNLAGAIITKWNVSERDISGVNLARAKIGSPNTTIFMNNTKARNCNCNQTQFIGKVMARRLDARGTTFLGAYMPYMDYRYANLEGCNFCDCVFSIGTAKAYGAKFDDKFFKDIGEFWGVEINIKSMEEKNHDTGRLKSDIKRQRRLQRES